MTKPEEMLAELEEAIDQLLKIAEKMKMLSFHVVSADQLDPLQKKQDELLTLISYTQKKFHEQFSEEEKRQTAIQKRIRKKLADFEDLNKTFINNLATTHELIDVDHNKHSQ
ncbi:MAG: hypothetical protein H7A37_04785 [Chlamydiales bacterium]|nr:hypothetical protein [Chlamydiia bacterium]MCP5507598.1 hypothetical protein [Chlamydiales bacterium]